VNRRKYQVSLAEDIAEKDANYVRLLRLLPELRIWREQSRRSSAEGFEGQAAAELTGHCSTFLLPGRDGSDIVMRIRITEVFRYTTSLEIVQQPEDPERLANPALLVRVYHDVDSTEVLSYQGQQVLQARYGQPNRRMYQVNEKALVNRFLGELLNHCLQCGRVRAGREMALQA